MRLTSDFFNTNAITLAKNLLGKHLVREINGDILVSKIVETEAYVGPEDKACHAYNNKRTKRTEVMFGKSGVTYVYLIYGMYDCLNIVAANEEEPQAVLIRAVEPVSDIQSFRNKRKIKSKKIEDLTNGPGKLCQALQITTKDNGIDLVSSEEIYLLNSTEEFDIVETPRINIDYAEEYVDKLWRFYIKGNRFVSKI